MLIGYQAAYGGPSLISDYDARYLATAQLIRLARAHAITRLIALAAH